MSKAGFVTVLLARFDHVRGPGPFEATGRPGLLFSTVGADVRAAAAEPASQRAYTFLIFGLHADADSARRFVDDRHTLAPWLEEARDVWSGVLQPFRHKGEANFLDAAAPGRLFDGLAKPAAADAPFVAITSVGWKVGPGFDIERVRQFGAGTTAIRRSMTAVDGLYSQQSFFFAGGIALVWDGRSENATARDAGNPERFGAGQIRGRPWAVYRSRSVAIRGRAVPTVARGGGRNTRTQSHRMQR